SDKKASHNPQHSPLPTPEQYKVFISELNTVAYDPLKPSKRSHTDRRISKETSSTSMKRGIRFEVKVKYAPRACMHFHRTEIGWIHKVILQALPTPTKQQGIESWNNDPAKRNKLAWTNENRELYGPEEQ
ncbi:hypothetical protein N7520_001056, partial [Penicillium odoratum]|uniref:uncharacterized protein n=1 Tax=Penicillium odoratum TaxID=1167516 RepID=UPI002546B0D8